MLDTTEALRHRRETEPGEVEERKHVAGADVEEEMGRAFVVAILEQLDEWEPEHVLIEADRALGISADEREVVHASTVRIGSIGAKELLAELGPPLSESRQIAFDGRHLRILARLPE